MKTISKLAIRMSLCAAALAVAMIGPAQVLSGRHGSALAQSAGVPEKEAFESAKELGTADAWTAFLASYPSGFHADLARAYLKKLSEQAPAPPPPAQAVAPRADEFPVDAGSWGGIVRSGPGQGFARQDSLAEGSTVSLMGVSPELDNGYPWFKIWYGPQQKKGYMWGGILCSKGAERPDLFRTCPGGAWAGASGTGRPGASPGFDCSEPANEAERSICANSQLSSLDAQLNSEYKLALSNITSEAIGGTSADVAQFRREQQDWLRQRNQCGSDISCLSSVYQARLRYLRERNQPE